MNCLVEQDGVEVGIRLLDDDPDPEEARTIIGPLPRQDTDWRPLPTLVSACLGNQAMTTVRIPMSRFCEPGFNAASLQAIELSFEDPGFEAQVFIDSIEFTSNEFDDAGNICPIGMYAWTCEATQVLIATETSCTAEPQSGSCNSTQQTGVSLPGVSEGMLSYDGWVIHSPAGAIVDEGDPSTEELEWLEARCVEACEMEWEHEPAIQANCSASGAFETPYVVDNPSLGAFTLTRPEGLDGSGPFMGESLTCNLDDSCCLEFDEALCIAKPRRVTRARDPLHAGEEFVVDVDWMVSVVNSTSGMVADNTRLTGTVGYSFCTDGNASAPCPFYVGSIELDAASDLDVGVECPAGGMGTVSGVFKLELDVGGSTVASPPSVTITSPSTISCPGTLSLSATVTDPDSDASSLRWYIDDVLMSSGTTSITMTEGHTLRAVARDARGAATTATHAVACT